MFEVGNLADEGVQIACKGHPAGPGVGGGEVLQKGEEFKRMCTVGLDAIPVGSFGHFQLPVATEDDLTIAGLPPVEVASESLALAMSKFERRFLLLI